MAMGMSSSSGGRRSRRGSRRAPMAEINVTPFVDVMLVLLIIFMVAAPLLASGVPVELPDSRATALPQEDEPITITVSPDGAIFIGDDPVAPGDLARSLSAIERLPGDTLPTINLRGDRSIDYGRMMGVMGELNRAGFTNIALLTGAATTEPIIEPASPAPAITAPSPQVAPDGPPAEANAVSDSSDSEP